MKATNRAGIFCVLILVMLMTLSSCSNLLDYASDADASAIASAASSLALPFEDGDSSGNVTQNLVLPSEGALGTTITWSSSDSAVISNTGTVTASAADTTVILTATIHRGSQPAETRIFTVTVKGSGPTVVNISAIAGVSPPVRSEIPATTITETAQYTGIVTWSGNPIEFAATTVYTATITLSAKAGYTLTGVAADYFTVAGTTSNTNPVDSGVISAVFPATGAAPPTVIDIAAIAGVTAPATGATPVTTITGTAQFTGTVTWSGSPATFTSLTVYTATVSLTAKAGYTLTGVSADYFTVAGTTSNTNPVNSGVITAVFPATVLAIGDAYQGGKVAYILQSGDPGYVAGVTKGLIAAVADQCLGIDPETRKNWSTDANKTTWVPSGTATAIGTGQANTNNIIAQNGAGSTLAAGLCDAYTNADTGTGVYSDWYLPSQNELNTLFQNYTAIGGFLVNMWYWSSSEKTNANVWITNTNLVQTEGGKEGFLNVRAVRSFP